ncbi:DNA-directed DNA polymerase eta rad30 [Tulasnella sp. 408]|nr:DNA-directed DNA polymerase eta rad30 [Tulasnella sp. 408]
MDRISAKGKEKANDYDDLNPVITYRHLLTNKMGVLDPLRVVALCDLDAFYAAAEQVRLNIDPELPLAVQQWQGLIAVNYPARKFGITRMENVTEAKKKCPELILVHVATFKEGESEPGYWENPDVNTHKVSLDHYRRESTKILNLHRECMDPTVEVEKASVDEAFFDFTMPVKKAILDRFPHLASPPPDAPLGLDTPLPPPPDISWEGRGNLVPINPKNPDEKEEPPLPTASTSTQPADPEETDDNHVTTWQDVALSIGAEFMMKSRMEVKNRLGYTTSALIASYKKRDQQSILRNAAIPGFLRYMPFQKVTFSALAIHDMQRKFGEESIWVYNILRGIDHNEVKEKVATKSMLASKNVRPNITKPVEVTHWLRVLSSELCVRLIEARERTPALWPKTLVLGFRQAFGSTKSKQSPFPFAKLITPELVLKPAEKLFKELSGSAPYKISNISLEDKAEALSKLQAEHADFHVAQDLAREVIDISSDDEDQRKKPERKKLEQKATGKTKSKPDNKKSASTKVKKPPEGIAKFFTNATKR